MNEIDIRKSMVAILYIMTELYNQRLGLNNSIAAKDVDPTVKAEIIREINALSGLNYNNLITDEDKMKYEISISNYMTQLLNRFKDRSRINDEIELLKKSVSVDTKELKFHNIKLSESVIDCLKDIKISLIGINSWLEKPDFVMLFKTDHNRDFLCTKAIKIEGVKKVLLFHVNIESLSFEVKSLFVLNFQKFNDMLNNPIRLFLFMVNEYGIDITINNITKKFHIATESNDGKCEFHMPEKNPKIIGYTISKRISPTKGVFHLAYGINLNMYVKDYRNRHI